MGWTPPLSLDRAYAVTVLDISQTAIDRARKRRGARASQIHWIVADVTAPPDLGSLDVWHDRAVFHFLTTPAERAAYAALLARTVPVGARTCCAPHPTVPTGACPKLYGENTHNLNYIRA
jgi:hypothetical protein